MGGKAETKEKNGGGFFEKVLGIFASHKSVKVGGPTGIPPYIGKVMVPQMHDLPAPDHWVRYLMVVRPQSGKTDSYDLRVIDEFEINTKDKKITVTDYAFLDKHPELIKFEGWFNSRTHQVEVKVKSR
jgi:hypothetical protein